MTSSARTPSAVPALTDSERRRFMKRVGRDNHGCWRWTGSVGRNGYGSLTLCRDGQRRQIYAHRVMYALSVGDPGGCVVRHTCDNPACVRPDHLLIGSQADNMRDAVERGRLNVDGLAIGHERQTRVVRARIAAGEKRCQSCKQTLEFSAFHRNRTQPDGYAWICKNCHKVRYRAAANRRRRIKQELRKDNPGGSRG